jgi:hypothetical protein
MNGAITYDSNNLQSFNYSNRTGIITSKINHTNQPNKDLNILALANASKSAIFSTEYPTKNISITGTILGSSQDDLDSRIDTFKAYFTGKDKNLDIDYAGSTRRYSATANGVSIKRQDRALFAEFDVGFICPLPFGFETSSTQIADDTAYTSSSNTYAPTIAGSAPYQYPIITLTLNTITGDGDYLQMSNDNNGQEMLIFGQGLVDGDVIVIDCFERTTKLKGEAVDYLGTFLELEPGPNSITYTDGFETRSVDINIVYYKRYL